MLKQHLLSYLDQQQQEIHEHLPGILTLNPDSIHDLRVAVKKIKSVFELLDHSLPQSNFIENSFPRYKRLFKALGKVRDQQVQKELLTKYENILSTAMASLKERFNQTITELSEQALEEAKVFDLDSISEDHQEVESALAPHSEPLILQHGLAYIHTLFDKIEKLKKDFDDIDKLHKSRGHLKKAYYMLDQLSEATGFEEAEPLINQAKDLASDAGAWHDQVVLYEEVKPFLKTFKGNHEPYQNLKKQLKKDIESFKTGYKIAIKSLLQDWDLLYSSR